MKVGEKYYFNVFLDNASGDKWFGYAITPTLIKIPLSTDSTTFGNFRHSKFLTVVAPNGRFSFSLDYSSEALIALVACVRKHLSTDEAITNPFEAKKSPVTTPYGSEDLYAEAAITSTNLLASMGGSYRLLPLDKVKTDFAGEHAVWVVAGAIGSLQIVLSEASTDTIASNLIAGAASRCKGKFATGKNAAEAGAYRIEVICQEADNGLLSYFFIVLSRPAKGFYVFTVVTADDTKLSRESASKMSEMILASQKN